MSKNPSSKRGRGGKREGMVEDQELSRFWAKTFSSISDRAIDFFIEWISGSVMTMSGGRNPREVWNAMRTMLENGTAYRTFKRRKSGGGWRTVTAPAESLKVVQGALHDLVFQRLLVHYASHAGMRRRSIRSAVLLHAQEPRAFYLVDLKDAYPSVTSKRIRSAIKPMLDEYLKTVASHLTSEERGQIILLVAEVSCYHERLAQGSPASVAIMNVVRLGVDSQIQAYLREQGDYVYTAYVDDLTISRADGDEVPEAVRKEIRSILTRNGFTPNRNARKRKEDHLPKEGPRAPILLGLLPSGDGRVTIPPTELKRFRATLHQALGQKEVEEGDRAKIAGIMGYVRMIYGDRPPSSIRRPYNECMKRFGVPKPATAGYNGA